MRRCKKFAQIGNFDDEIGQYRNALRRAPAGAALSHGDLRGGRLAARAVHRRFPERGRTRFCVRRSRRAGRIRSRVARRAPSLAFCQSPAGAVADPFRPGRGDCRQFGHYALYALLLAVPIVGIVAQLKRGNALPIFGVWHLASPWPADRAAAHSVMEVHELLANALLILAALHAVRGPGPSLCVWRPHARACCRAAVE